jgi:hypothetical protein
MASNFEEALRLMEAALTDCPEDLWETDLWPDEAPTGETTHGGLHGSAPWFLAYHALLTLDYDLTAEFEPWEPPPPFDENTYSSPNRMFTKVPLHIVEHASQIRQFLTAAEAKVQPMPGDRGYAG